MISIGMTKAKLFEMNAKHGISSVIYSKGIGGLIQTVLVFVRSIQMTIVVSDGVSEQDILSTFPDAILADSLTVT